jgi:putative lipoic acid-binding regulatory protein
MISHHTVMGKDRDGIAESLAALVRKHPGLHNLRMGVLPRTGDYTKFAVTIDAIDDEPRSVSHWGLIA